MHPIKHFMVITKHRNQVIKHCAKCGIFWQGLRHDLSKYTPTEFLQGAKYFIGSRSPNEGERADKGFSTAWMHHQGRNKHHFEYWKDYNPQTRRLSPVKMPYRYVIEMFCINSFFIIARKRKKDSGIIAKESETGILQDLQCCIMRWYMQHKGGCLMAYNLLRD